VKHRRSPLVLLFSIVLVITCSVANTARAGPFIPMASRLPRLIIKPNPVPLGQRIAVILTGVKRSEHVQFAVRPMKASFGGGNMGTHRAGKDGTILFSYPAFTQSADLGTWLITARRANRSILQTRLQVTEPSTPLPTPVYPPLAHAARRQLALPGRSSGPSAVSGSMVAATVATGTGCSRTIYLRQLPTGRWQPTVHLARDVCQLDVQLSAQWLVWLAGRYSGPGWQLRAWNRKTHQRHLVDSSATEGGPAAPSFPEISLSGNTLALRSPIGIIAFS
jgi:hypothetical protein